MIIDYKLNIDYWFLIIELLIIDYWLLIFLSKELPLHIKVAHESLWFWQHEVICQVFMNEIRDGWTPCCRNKRRLHGDIFIKSHYKHINCKKNSSQFYCIWHDIIYFNALTGSYLSSVITLHTEQRQRTILVTIK